MINGKRRFVAIFLSLFLVVGALASPTDTGTAASKSNSKRPVLQEKRGTCLIGTSETVSIKNVTQKKVRKLTVKSSDPSVASVNPAGAGKKTAFRIKIKKKGKATITASVSLKNKKKYKLTYKLTAKKVIKRAVPVFRETETDEKAEVRYYAGTPHIAYMDINDYYQLFLPTESIRIEPSLSDSSVYSLTSPTGTAVVDVAKDTLFSNDYYMFSDISRIIDDNSALGESCYLQNDKTEILRPGNPVTFDFKKYHIDLKADVRLYPLLKETGSFDQALERYENDGLISGSQLKEALLSEDVGEYLDAFDALNYLLDDGGHTVFQYFVPALERRDGFEQFDDLARKALKEKSYLWRAVAQVYETGRTRENGFLSRKKMRNDLFGLDPEKAMHPVDKSKYVEKGDTAICVLDTFAITFDGIDLLNKYAREPIATRTLPEVTEERYDPVIQFLDALEKADKNPAIRNFVLDLSNNDGGYIIGVFTIATLMSGKPLVDRWVNTLTNEYTEASCKIDLNFDGVIDEKDKEVNWGKRFRFAVLTSCSSYSSPNTVAKLAKESGIPVLGEKSGGGACVVSKRLTADGFTYYLSSCECCITDASGADIDSGIPVDIDLLIRDKDGSVKKTEVEIADCFTNEPTVVRINDYSQFYDLDRLSKEINAWYDKHR